MRILFLILMWICVIAGRVHTFDMTEGQALVEGGVFWGGALCWGFLAWYPFRQK